MSDIKGIEVHDILGLSQPLTKLIETVSCGIGTFYAPFHKKRMAKANAKEIEIISEAVNDNISLPISYDAGQISIDTKNANDLVIRAQNRFLFQQMKKQQNIESIIANAYGELENKTVISGEPVDSDWISSFFDFTANISNEQMQLLWGKLLAGEVERPGSFSIRTLDVLRKLTQKEATMFKEITPFILKCPSDASGIFEDNFLLYSDIIEKHGISFPKIMILNEAGLISENGQINIGLELKAGEMEYIWNVNHSLAIQFKNIGDTLLRILHPAYILTEAGKELLPITLECSCLDLSEEYMEDCLKDIKEKGIIAPGTRLDLSKVAINLIKE